MANPTNRQLWELAVRLNSAWLEFASADAKRRYSELPSILGKQANAANVQSGLGLANLLASSLGQWTQRAELESELREQLLIELFNDELHAYAYRVSPSRSRSPVRIAAELFDVHDPDWQSETLLARGIEYAEIRIVDPIRIAGFQRRRTGRKGSAQAIRDAIAALQSEGFDLCGIPRKVACDAIREKIGNSYAKGSGFSNVNLSKYILEKCQRRGIDK